jgi:phospholipase/carboxylesterase
MNRAANPHLELAPWFAGVPIADARAVGVLVHGRDQGPEVMLEVTERLRLDEVAYVLPAAAQRSWYPGRYYDPLAQNEPDLTWSLEACEAAIAVATDAGVAPRRIVLGGFSQGACLVAELIARSPRRLAGVAVLTGALLGPDGQQREPAPAAGLRMFFASSKFDQWVAVDDVHATARAFERAGAVTKLETYEDRVHEVSDAAVAGLRRLFEPLLA